MSDFLERTFRLRENGTTVRTELRAGTVTFLTMAYIIFVQPAVLSACGMDTGAVMMATCLSAAIATFVMGVLANYPIALAPAMGENFIFTFTMVPAFAAAIAAKLQASGMTADKAKEIAGVQAWQAGLAVILISGVIFLVLSVLRFRETIMAAIPESLRHAIATGIGLLIAFVGLELSGLKTKGELSEEASALLLRCRILFVFGFALIACLLALRVKGAILIGMLVTAIVGIPLGLVEYHGTFSAPPSISPTFFKLRFAPLLCRTGIEMIFVFFLLDLFDTVGTLVAVGHQAGFVKEDGTLPRAGRAFFSDALGTVSGALLGTSTVTSYVESATGVAEGGRTGLANMVTAGLFILAIFFKPIVSMVGGGVEVIQGASKLQPVIAPVLLIIGAIIMRSVTKINWEDYTEAIPGFLTLIIMPTTLSITDGIAAGFISYCVLKLVTRRGKEVSWILYIFAAVFAVRFLVIAV